VSTRPSLDDLELFCAVGRERSFTRVARDLDMPLATLSRRVARLEQQLDAQLLRRSTRRVQLTDAGALLLARSEAPLAGLGQAFDCLAEDAGTPRGRLRVTLPADLARYWLSGALAAFAARHPEIRLEIDLSSRLVNLVEEGFDLAIRAGRPEETSLIARRLATLPNAVYASPSYLAALPAIRHPRDLASANALVLAGRRSDRRWTLRHGRETASVTPHGNLQVNDMSALAALAADGAGVAMLPLPAVDRHAAGGRLVDVLPGWRGPDTPVYAIYASRRMPLRLRLLLEHLRLSIAGPDGMAPA
jgi:DNA-binding transcriptional LysR family regulator